MSKIVFFNGMFLPTFPYIEVPLFNELKSRGLEVQYVLRDGDYRLINDDMRPTFEAMNLAIIKTKNDILSLMSNGDLFLISFAQKPGEWDFDVSEIVRKAGYKIFMHDVAGYDVCTRDTWAHYMSVKSEYMKKEIARHGRTKRFERIFVTGTVHHDQAAMTLSLDRDAFMTKYGLDPSKKFALMTPGNPDELFIHNNIMVEYSHIINTITQQCPDYELAIKCHPFDYTEHLPSVPGIKKKKMSHQWDKNAPGIPIIEAAEGYSAIRAADVVVSVVSSLSMEICLFNKPLVVLNRDKHRNEWPQSTSHMKNIKSSDLADTLNNCKYGVDQKACDEFCKYVAHSRDGKAYIRIADAIQEVF